MLRLSFFALSLILFNQKSYAVPCASIVKSDGETSVRDFKNESDKIVLSVKYNSRTIEIVPDERAVDVVIDRNIIYAVGKTSIEEWSIESGRRIQKWALPLVNRPYDQPYAAAKAGRTIFIAHGRSGLVAFDTNSGKITSRQTLVSDNGILESSARGVVARGRVCMWPWTITLLRSQRLNQRLRE